MTRGDAGSFGEAQFATQTRTVREADQREETATKDWRSMPPYESSGGRQGAPNAAGETFAGWNASGPLAAKSEIGDDGTHPIGTGKAGREPHGSGHEVFGFVEGVKGTDSLQRAVGRCLCLHLKRV
jgi:hypothetical protein